MEGKEYETRGVKRKKGRGVCSLGVLCVGGGDVREGGEADAWKGGLRRRGLRMRECRRRGREGVHCVGESQSWWKGLWSGIVGRGCRCGGGGYMDLCSWLRLLLEGKGGGRGRGKEGRGGTAVAKEGRREWQGGCGLG